LAHAFARRRARALRSRYVSGALARSRPARRRLRDVRAESRRDDRPGTNEGRVAGNRLQLRFPGSPAETGAALAERAMNVLLLSMPDAFEHMPPIAIRMP